jgi:hypothetical protein
MRATVTTFTCDRCGVSKAYEHVDVPGASVVGDDWGKEWAEFFPAAVGILNYGLVGVEPGHVCFGCLTNLERKSLARQRLQYDNVTF